MKEVVRNSFNNRSKKNDSELLCFRRIINTEKEIESRRSPCSGCTPFVVPFVP